MARQQHLMRYQNSAMLVQDVYAYDTYGNRTAHKRQDTNNKTAIRSTSAYTADGDRLASQTDPRGNKVSYAYNANGSVSKTTLPNGQSVSYGYDASGRVTSAQATTSAGTHKSVYAYANDRLTQVSHNTTGAAADVSYSFGYDAFGKPTTVKVGSQLLSENVYETNRHQQLKKVNYGNGQSVENRYDEHGRLTGKKFGTDTAWRWEYGYAANGEIAQLKDNILKRIIRTEYDTANRPEMTLVQDSGTGSLIYRAAVSYDSREHISSQRERVSGANYTTSYSYDWDDRATDIQYGDATHRVRYGYDGQGRLLTRRVTNGSADQTATYSYLGSSVAIPGLSTVSSTNLVSGISQPLVSFAYGYAGNTDNIVSETRTGGSYAGTTTYEYDSLGQLTRVNDPVEGTTRVYRYDLGGNMVSHAKYAYTTGALGTAQGETVYSYGAAGWKDRLTALGNKALEYDAIGNLTSYNGWTYEWEAGRQLKRQVKSSGTDVKYEYDQNGMRVRKTVNGTATNYTYNGSRLVHLTTGSNKLHFYYDAQGKPALVNYNGTQYSYLYNLQGDVIGLVDNAGSLVVEYKYNAWGSITGRAGSLAATLGKLNPFRYRGYVYDEETWMYYCGARYYYPELQRWICADDGFDEGAGFAGCNLFTYCANRPVSFYDPSGDFLISVLFICAAAGAIIGGTIGSLAGNYYADSKEYTGWDKVRCVITGAATGAVIGGIGGYAVAPSVIAITGVASVSVTTAAGITLIPAHFVGQYHHVLSNPIMRALENHPLRGVFQRATSVIQAMTQDAHRGYQGWHRFIDGYMVSWLQNHQNATESEFWRELYKLYNTKDMISRFGEDVLKYIKQQMK